MGIPIVEKELENSGTADETVVVVRTWAAVGTAMDEEQFVTNIWKQDNCLENDIFEKIKENEEVAEDTNGMKFQSNIENASGDDSERNRLLEYIGKVEGNPFLYRCVLCGKTSNNRYRMKNHVENIHFPGMFSYPCKFCDKILLTKQSFRKHKNFHKTTQLLGRPEKEKERNRLIVHNNIDITKEAAAIVVVADDAKFAGHNGQFVKNISQQVNCLEDDMFQEMEENEKFVEATNGMKVRSNIENVSGQSLIKKIDDSERNKLLEYIEKEEGNMLVYRCVVCDKTSNKIYTMKNHVESVHFPGMFSYPCKFCDKTLLTKQSLMGHEKLHKTKRVLDLPEKGTVRNESIISDNIEIVGTDSKALGFRCKVCDKICAQKSNLFSHIESIHFPGCYMYWCKVCMKTFDTKQSLYSHMKTNHKETIKARARNKERNDREEFIRKDDTNISVPIFRCNMCDFTNIRRDQVRDHVERKHCLRIS